METTTIYKQANGKVTDKGLDAINNGATDGTYFYLHSDGSVSVSNPYMMLSVKEQEELLEWVIN